MVRVHEFVVDRWHVGKHAEPADRINPLALVKSLVRTLLRLTPWKPLQPATKQSVRYPVLT